MERSRSTRPRLGCARSGGSGAAGSSSTTSVRAGSLRVRGGTRWRTATCAFLKLDPGLEPGGLLDLATTLERGVDWEAAPFARAPYRGALAGFGDFRSAGGEWKTGVFVVRDGPRLELYVLLETPSTRAASSRTERVRRSSPRMGKTLYFLDPLDRRAIFASKTVRSKRSSDSTPPSRVRAARPPRGEEPRSSRSTWRLALEPCCFSSMPADGASSSLLLCAQGSLGQWLCVFSKSSIPRSAETGRLRFSSTRTTSRSRPGATLGRCSRRARLHRVRASSGRVSVLLPEPDRGRAPAEPP